MFVLRLSLSYPAQGLLFLFDIHVALLLLLLEVLSHFAQVVGQKFIVGHSIVEIYAFSEAYQINRSRLLRLTKPFGAIFVSGTEEASLGRLRVWIRNMVVMVICRGGATGVGNRGRDHGYILRGTRAFSYLRSCHVRVARLGYLISAKKLFRVLPLH